MQAALRRPPGDARDRAALSGYLTETVDAYSSLQAAASSGDAQGVASAEARLRSSPVGALASSYGLSSCGTPSATVQ